MIASQHGNSLVVETQEVTQYFQNISHARKLQLNEKEIEMRELQADPKEPALQNFVKRAVLSQYLQFLVLYLCTGPYKKGMGGGGGRSCRVLAIKV